MDAFSIRSATAADQIPVAEFNIALARETEDLGLDRNTVRAGVAAILTNPSNGLYFVAERDGELVGQVMITYEWSDWRNGNIWWLQSVYVRKDWRGRGVFKALFEHVRKRAEEAPGVCGIRLYMHNGNERARSVYEKLGFESTAYEVLEMPIRHG